MRKLLLLLIFCSLILSGCNFFAPPVTNPTTTPTQATTVPESEIADVVADIKKGLPLEISDDFVVTIPTEYPNATVSFTSSNEAVLSNSGKYIQPENDTKVTLTITVNYNEETETFTHEITVKGIPANEKLAELKETLVIEQTSVKASFDLPTVNKYDATVEWTCSLSDFAEVSGNQLVVTRPSETFIDETVTLTATIKIGSEQVKKEFSITVLALTVTEISVSTLPTKLNVALNATEMDVTGGQLLVTLDDSSTKTIDLTKNMVASLPTSEIGTQTVTVEYLGCETTFDITVYKPASAVSLNVGESKTVDFENELDLGLTIDPAQTPNSTLITEGAINGNSSLYIESDGGFKTLFIKDFVDLKANETYVISFSYQVVSMVDTIYFQLADTGKFTQFGNPNELNTTKKFEWIYSASVDANLIQIFPGGGSGKTKLIIDDIKVERVLAEENVYKTSLDNVGDYVLETFGDPSHTVITLDTAPAPSSAVVSQGIDGSSLSFVSNGGYAGVYLKPNSGLLKSGNLYKVSFDYVLTELADTIYFQWYNNGAASFVQFGSSSQIGTEVQHFECEVEVTDNALIFHIFPGTTAATTQLLIDNFRIEKLETPVRTYSVTYVINGHGEQPDNLTEQTNLPAELPVLSEEGYTFDGWYTNAGLTEVAVAGAELTADVTLYAKWTANNPDPVVEENVYKESLDNAGDYVLETFGDVAHQVIVLDTAPAPDSNVVTEGILGSSLAFASNGGFNGVYFKPNTGLLKAGNTYIVSFDYVLTALGDTIYFQWYNNGAASFVQFGLANQIGAGVQHFECEIVVTDDACIMHMFPGGTAAQTALLIDNFKIEKKAVEENVYKESLDNAGDYVLETFGDAAHQVIVLDTAETPDSAVVTEGIEGSSLSYVSNGNYAGTYFKPNAGLLKAGNTYKVSFDYVLTALGDTIYFQYYNNGTPTFTQFGLASEVGTEVHHFEYTIVVTDDACIIKMFPGGTAAQTALLIDNFKIEKLLVEENVYKESLDNAGDYVLETFGDSAHQVIVLDTAPAPDSNVVTEGIEGSSLAFASNGGFNGVYFKPNTGLLKAGNTYIVSFDYVLTALGDTIYFQWYNNGAASFVQFGLANQIGAGVQHFECEIVVTDDACIMHMFPGGTAAQTALLIDNFKIEKKAVEENVYKESLDNAGDYVLETFGDAAHQVIVLDTAETPDSAVVTEGIEGSSLSYVSNGNYAGTYFKPNAGLLKAGNTYKVSFDYVLTALGDTIYFQYYNNGTPTFTQFGLASEVGTEVHHFEYTIVVTDDACIIKMFPGGTAAQTALLIDNFKIEKLA